MRISLLISALLLVAAPAVAQEAPAPDAVPVPPVETVPLEPPPPQVVSGPASAINGEILRVGEEFLVIFGIQPRSLDTAEGLAARTALDGLLAGGASVECTVVGVDQNQNRVASCRAGDVDLASFLLEQGLAIVNRLETQSLGVDPDLAVLYDAAEAKARAEDRGIWQGFIDAEKASERKSEPDPLWLWLERWQAGLGLGLLALVLLVTRLGFRGRR